MSGRCYVRRYDVGADEVYQVQVTEDEAVRAALTGHVVGPQPLTNLVGRVYPIRPIDAAARDTQREAEIRAYLRTGVKP